MNNIFSKILLAFAILFLFNLKIQANNSTDTNIFIVNKIIIAGNSKTKEKIILRELLFSRGDTILKTNFNQIFKKTKENLYNTSLFNFITINSLIVSGNKIDIYIILEERWYLWPYPILEHADRNLSSFLHEKDWRKINYGLMVTQFNFRGRKETLKIKTRIGFKEQFQIYYDVPYLTKNKKHGISAELSWYRQKQIDYNIRNDRLNNYRDSQSYIRKYQTVYLNYLYRNLFYNSHFFTIGYVNANVLDTVTQLNPNYFGEYKSSLKYFSLGYLFSHDKRDYKYYPLTGHNVITRITRVGLNIFDDGINPYWDLGLEAYKYFDFGNRLYGGIGGSTKISNKKDHPFFVNYGLGYKDYIRAYEYNVIKGHSYFTTRTFFKYSLVPQKVIYIQSWGWKKFNKIHYRVLINAFFDSGYVLNNFVHPTNKLPNQYLYSYGIGIDIPAYYDIVFRFECSVNKENKPGFFIHFGKAF